MILNPFTAPVYTRLINIDNSFVSEIFDKALFIDGDSWSQLSLIFLKNIYDEYKEEETDSSYLGIKLLLNLILQLNSAKNNKSGINNNIYYIEKNLQLVINNYFQTLKGLDEKVYNRLKYVKDKIENNSYKNIGLDNFNIILSNRDTLKLRNIEKEYFKAEKLNIYENLKNKYKGINIKKNNISLREIQQILYFNKFTESLCKDINLFSFNKSLYEFRNRENIIISRINNIGGRNENIIEKHLKVIEDVQNKIDKNNGFRVFSNIVFRNINNNVEKLIDSEILSDIKKYKEIKSIKNVQEENLKRLLINEISTSAEISHLNILKEKSKLENLYIKDEINLNKVINKDIDPDYDIASRKRLNTAEIIKLEKLNIINKKNIKNEINYFKQELKEYFETHRLTQFRSQGSKEIIEENLISKGNNLILNHNFINLLENEQEVNLNGFTVSGFRNEINNINKFSKVLKEEITSPSLNSRYIFKNKANILRSNSIRISEKIIENNLKVIEDIQNKIDKNNSFIVFSNIVFKNINNNSEKLVDTEILTDIKKYKETLIKEIKNIKNAQEENNIENLLKMTNLYLKEYPEFLEVGNYLKSYAVKHSLLKNNTIVQNYSIIENTINKIIKDLKVSDIFLNQVNNYKLKNIYKLSILYLNNSKLLDITFREQNLKSLLINQELNENITSYSLNRLYSKSNILGNNTSIISEKIIENNLKVIDDIQNKIDKNNSFRVFSNIVFKNISSNSEKLINTEILNDIKRYKEILIKEIKNVEEENLLKMADLYTKEYHEFLQIENYMKFHAGQDRLVRNNTFIESNSIIKNTANTLVKDLKVSDVFLDKIHNVKFKNAYKLNGLYLKNKKLLDITFKEENLKTLLINEISDSAEISHLNTSKEISTLENLYIKKDEINLNKVEIDTDYNVNFRKRLNAAEILNLEELNIINKKNIENEINKLNILPSNIVSISERIIEKNLKVIEDVQNKIDKNNGFRVFSNIVFKNINNNIEKSIDTEILTDIKKYKEILIKQIKNMKNVQVENLLKMRNLYFKEHPEFLEIEDHIKSYYVQDSLVKDNTLIKSNSVIESTVNKTVKDLKVSEIFLEQIHNLDFKNIYKLNELYLKNRKLLDITFREENLKGLLINESSSSVEILNLEKLNIENEISYLKQELKEYIETQRLTQVRNQRSKEIKEENLVYKSSNLILNHDFISLLENEKEVNLNEFVSGFRNEINNINDFNKVLNEDITSYSLNRLYNKSNILRNNTSSISEKIIEKNLKVIEDVQNKIDKNNGFRVFSNILFKNINNSVEKSIDTEILTDIKRYKEILIKEIKNIKNVQEENHIENLRMRNLYLKEHAEFLEIENYMKSYTIQDSLIKNNTLIQSNRIIENIANTTVKDLKVSHIFLDQIHNSNFKNTYKLNELYLKNRKLLDITFREENLKRLLINETSSSEEIRHLNILKEISKLENLNTKDEINLNKVINKEIDMDYDINLRKRLNTAEIFNLEKLNIINKKNIENEINYFKQELREYLEKQRLTQVRSQASKEIIDKNLISKNKSLILTHDFVNLLENKMEVNLDKFTITGFRNEIKNINEFNKVLNEDTASYSLNRLYILKNKSNILKTSTSSISEKIIERNLKVIEDVQNKIDKNNVSREFSNIVFKNINNTNEKLIDFNEMYLIQKTFRIQGKDYISEFQNPLYTSDIDLKYKKIETVNDYEQVRSEPRATEVEFDEQAMYKVINNTVETLLEEKFSQINQNNIDEEEQINNLSKKVMAKIEKSLSYEKRRIGLM